MPSSDRQTRRVAAGVACILGIAVLAVLIFMLDRVVDQFRRTYQLVAVFPDAPALVEDAPVWIAGKRVGRVSQVGLMPAGYDTIPVVAVAVKLPRRFQAQVRRDSYARLTSATVIGERVIDIVPGSATEPPLLDGDTLDIDVPRRYALLRERIEAAQSEFDTVRARFAELRAPLAARRAVLEPVRHDVEQIAREIERLRLTFETGPAAAALGDDGLRDTVRRLRTRVAELGTAIARAAGASPGTGEDVRAAIDSLAHRTERAGEGIAALEERLADVDGFVGRLARDTALHVAAHAARAEIDSLTGEVRRNPFRFVRLRFW
jgi:phospholipid/cholesterol/gamma-HCH transport system substrate-binding protein